jgi:dihydroflavonol-4-reductase
VPSLVDDSAVLVAGATGFIGRILVPRLVADGRRVRVLERRPGAVFDGLGVEVVRGDVTDRESLAPAMDGMSSVINLAGIVSHLEADRPRMEAVSVTGAENVLTAARTAGVNRVVHVSSVASVGMADDPDHPLDEDSPFPERARQYPYAATKRAGEEVAMRAAASGQDVVIANPAFVIGAGDVNRISTFVAEQYLRGTLRISTAGGLNYVDVRDVAEGLLLIERSGASGRRYILGTPDGNLSYREFFDLLGDVSGKRRLTLPLPTALLGPSALALRALRALHVPLPVHPDELVSSRWYWYSKSTRAMSELGYAPRPVREAAAATVAYLRERGLRGR